MTSLILTEVAHSFSGGAHCDAARGLVKDAAGGSKLPLLAPNHCRTDGLRVDDYEKHSEENCKCITELNELSSAYEKAVKQEIALSAQELVVATVGKVDSKRRIEESVVRLMSANIVHCLGTMLDTVVF